IKSEARIHTDLLNTVIFVNNKSHLHSANAIKLEVRKRYEDLRYHAINSNEPPANIVTNSFKNYKQKNVAVNAGQEAKVQQKRNVDHNKRLINRINYSHPNIEQQIAAITHNIHL
ncbi:unnamed protein product, partial [Didymodactylos carnosus]